MSQSDSYIVRCLESIATILVNQNRTRAIVDHRLYLELYSIPYPWPLDNGMDMDSGSRGYG
eukprot:scaffold7124_cov55-Cyclotella_meneghiniana.AAC.1